LGNRDEALADVERANASIAEVCDIDDLAVTEARLASLLFQLGRSEESSDLRRTADRHLADHQVTQNNLQQLLTSKLPGQPDSAR
jgi:hypothetical protein